MFIRENHILQFRYDMYIQDSINSLIACRAFAIKNDVYVLVVFNGLYD